jgi:NADPH2:quinone reductase
MTESTRRQIVLAARPHGPPQTDNFRLEQDAMPAVPPGGVLLRVLHLSLDPYMRGRMDDRKPYARPAEVGEVMPGESVAEVIASDHPGYVKGDILLVERPDCTWRFR